MNISRTFVVCLMSLAAVAATTFLPKQGKTVPAVPPSNGSAPNDACTAANLSASGRTMAFISRASNLLPDDTDKIRDIVVASLKDGHAALASVSTAGVKGDADCDDPMLDRAGKRVVFSSFADNLVDGDTNAVQDVFLRDLKHHTTQRVSVASDGTQGDNRSVQPVLSGSGNVVAFTSQATNLVADDTNGVSDVFVHDQRTGVTRRVSLAADGTQADGMSFSPALSASGRYVAFLSEATNLVPGLASTHANVYVRDLKTGAIKMVSVAPDGAAGDLDSLDVTVSSNGRRVAFSSAADNLVEADGHVGWDIFVRDMKKGVTMLVTQGLAGAAADADSRQATISRSGKWLAFTSDATNLVSGDTNGFTDIFRMKLKTRLVDRVSISSDGVESNGNSDQPALGKDARFVAFSTRATNLFQAAPDGVWSVALRRP
jgi:Tol biopolymer transport system component